MTFLCEFCGCGVPEDDLRAAGPTTDEGYACISCYEKGKRKPHAPMLYIDQTITVSSKTDNPPNGVIRVTFKDITLSMSIVDASWLAANIQREIRTVEREHPELAWLSDGGRHRLKAGDVVLVRDDQGNEFDYEVKRAPWQLGHGAWVIGLKGISGGYSLDRVVKLVRSQEQPSVRLNQ